MYVVVITLTVIFALLLIGVVLIQSRKAVASPLSSAVPTR